MGQVGGSGSTAGATAAQSSGPSASYAGRLIAAIKPNVVFVDRVTDNQAAEVEVRTGPSGSILSRRLLRSSGNKDWDEAVLRAIDRTGTLPRDVDGRVPPVLVMAFRPAELHP
jgi:colicin import membrane protein